MIKYKVSIGYNRFMFDNAAEAMALATTAKTHYDARKDDDDIDVEIEIINEVNEVCENKED